MTTTAPPPEAPAAAGSAEQRPGRRSRAKIGRRRAAPLTGAASRLALSARPRFQRALGSTSRFFIAVAAVVMPIVRIVWAAVSPVLRTITGTGWIVLALGIVSLVLSTVFGWQEFTFLATVLLAALLVSIIFLVGRASYGVLIELNPRRVVVGDRAMGRLLVTNTGEKTLPPTRMELPVGTGLAAFQLPGMKPKEEHEELFAVPTHKRAVIIAGPAESVRGDQLGLLRRAQKWADPVDLFVHPKTVRIAPSAAGLVRDLEGQVSNKITNNDLAFHALRPYVPGDDRRYVHWRTSARIGQHRVRQFQETRRSQLTMIHASRGELYASEAEFELAISVTTSIAAQVIADGTQMNVVSESGMWRTQTPTSMLDSSCRIEPVGRTFPTLRAFARERTRRLPAPSVVMIVGGSGMTVPDFRSIQSLFGQDTSQVGFHVVEGAEPKISVVAGLTMITVGDLSDLPALVRGLSS